MQVLEDDVVFTVVTVDCLCDYGLLYKSATSLIGMCHDFVLFQASMAETGSYAP